MLAVVGVQDQGDRAGLGVVAGQGGDPGTVGLGPRCLRCPAAVPGAGAGEQFVGAVDLVAGGAEVLPDRAEVGAAGDAVLEEPGGLRMVGVGGAGAGVDPQLGLQRLADRAGADETDQAAGEDRCLRPGGQADRQPPGGDVIDRGCPGRRRRRCRRRSAARTAPGPGAGSPRRSHRDASRPGRRDAARPPSRQRGPARLPGASWRWCRAAIGRGRESSGRCARRRCRGTGSGAGG